MTVNEVVFVDTETTGLDPELHEIWDLAIIEESGTEHEYHFQPNLRSAEPGALRVNRFYERTLGRWSWNDASNYAESIARLLANKHIVGAVPSFDAEFLRRYLNRYGEQAAWHYHLIDVETLAVGWLARRGAILPLPWDSRDLANRLGINSPVEDKHTAIGDARWAKAIYEKVMAGKDRDDP